MKYIILCLIGLLCFTGCSKTLEDSSHKGKLIYERILKKHEASERQQENPVEKTVQLLLKASGNHVELLLENPKGISIRSVRTWLSFPAGKLTVKNLNLNKELFDLAAPNEYIVDKKNGIIRIGLSTTQKLEDTTIKIGSFDVFNTSDTDVPLNCYDYGDNSDSHCMVLGNNNNNILLPTNPLLISKK